MLYKLEIDSKGVATVTLNRPEMHNAFNAELIKELTDTFQRIERNRNIRVVVLTGEGKSFCAGADINWMGCMKNYTYEENLADSQKLCDLFTIINNCPYPVIGRVNGHALGGGAGLVACCDYVLAVNTALMGFTEVKLGLIPAVISPFVIAKIGEGYARATFMNGEKFSAEKAMHMGLVHQIATVSELDKVVNAVIDTFLSAAPEASIAAKSLIKNVVKHNAVISSRDYTCEAISKIRIGKEGQEGMTALLEKRKASWI